MKTKRLLGLLLVACALVVVFTSCATAADAPVTLRWAVWDETLVAYYQPLITRYTELNPHVSFELVDLGAAEFERILQTQLIGGAEYDVIKIRDVPSYAMHVNANLLLPLNDRLGNAGVDLGNYLGIPEQFMVDGNLYSLPFRSDFWLIFYNKDKFDEAGAAYPTNRMTFDGWAQIIRDVTHGSGNDLVWGNIFHTWASTTTLFGILTGEHTIADGAYDWLVPFYETVHALEDGGYVPRFTDLRVGGVHYSAPWFNQQVAMCNMGTWFAATCIAQIEAGVNEATNWGLAAYPVPEAAYHGNTLGQVTQLAIPRTAKNADEAMAFIAFVAGAEGASIMASVGQFPAYMTDDALDTILAIPGFPQDDTTREAMRPNNIFLEMPMHEFAAEINAIRNEAHEEIMTRNISIQEGIDMMNQRIGSELLGQ